jgi:hypothetical protein
MSISSSARSQSSATELWREVVDLQTKLQARIEAAHDLADSCEHDGEFKLAIECLGLASELSGGLSPASRAQRERCARELEPGQP